MSPLNGKKKKEFPEKKCPKCQTAFKPSRSWQRFCSTPCRWQEWNKTHPRQLVKD